MTGQEFELTRRNVLTTAVVTGFAGGELGSTPAVSPNDGRNVTDDSGQNGVSAAITFAEQSPETP